MSRLLENSRSLHEQVRGAVGREEYQRRIDAGLDAAAHALAPTLSEPRGFGLGD